MPKNTTKPTCTICGKALRNVSKTKKCRACSAVPKAVCVDCGKPVSKNNVERCRECCKADKLKKAQEADPAYRRVEFCIECGTKLKNLRASRCRACISAKTLPKALCIDCGKPVSKNNIKRCMECHKADELKKAQEANPENPNIGFCITCGIKLRYRTASKCWACYSANSKAFCVDCGKRISSANVRRCRECWKADERKKAQAANPAYRRFSSCVLCGAELKGQYARICGNCQKLPENNPNWRGGTMICPECGGRKSFISKRCLSCANKDRQGLPKCLKCGNTLSTYKARTGYCKACYRGERTARWKPDLDKNTRVLVRLEPEYRVWRKAVYDRDSYTCQKCLQHGGNLEAHHIEAYKSYPELRYDVDNGVTLCVICHRRFHSIYGRGNNTRTQFDEYMSLGND